MLYRPEAFEPLTENPWNVDAVSDQIREIVADTDDALRGPKLMWRADDWDRWQATSPMKNLYVGSAGMLWALDELRRFGHAETRSACTFPTSPCGGFRLRSSWRYRRCVQRPSSPRRDQSASALACQASRQRSSAVQSSIARAAISVPGVPYITSSASFETFARTRSRRSSASPALGASRQAQVKRLRVERGRGRYSL